VPRNGPKKIRRLREFRRLGSAPDHQKSVDFAILEAKSAFSYNALNLCNPRNLRIAHLRSRRTDPLFISGIADLYLRTRIPACSSHRSGLAALGSGDSFAESIVTPNLQSDGQIAMYRA
jgi:hypothetical protein